jgi:hypothetical protein
MTTPIKLVIHAFHGGALANTRGLSTGEARAYAVRAAGAALCQEQSSTDCCDAPVAALLAQSYPSACSG